MNSTRPDNSADAGKHTAVLPCIAGPTGAGKTAAALALSRKLGNAVIVNADSRQVYADFPLITAQPSAKEQAECEHRLYGFLPCAEKLGAGEYARLSKDVIEESFAAGKQPILVGGTGLYFKTLLEGIAPIPDIPDEVHARWQAELASRGSPDLHAELSRHDPKYAARIHQNDKQRVTRALEVWQATGKTFSWWHTRPLSALPYVLVKTGIGLPMPELEPILQQRIELMLQAGALEEARAALAACPDPQAPGWSGIGCRELLDFLTGALSMEECRELWYRNTRAYAKRQYTWFRADKNISWFRPEQKDELAQHIAQKL